jgi:hypothetical protein
MHLTYEEVTALVATMLGVERCFATRTAFAFTPEEMAQCFIRPDHRLYMLQASALVAPRAIPRTYNFRAREIMEAVQGSIPHINSLGEAEDVVGQLGARVALPNATKILLPEYAMNGFASGAPADVIERFTAAQVERLKFVQAVATLAGIFRTGHYGNISVAALALMAPALVPLMERTVFPATGAAKGAGSRALARKSAMTKSASTKRNQTPALPAMPRAAREAIYEASNMLNIMLLTTREADQMLAEENPRECTAVLTGPVYMPYMDTRGMIVREGLTIYG